MKYPSLNNYRTNYGFKLILLLAFSAVILFSNLSAWGVTETSEARFAEISREMYRSGDFMHPTLLNIGHYHKPPVTYWITMFAYEIFGPGMFATRFFLQIAVLIQIILVYKITQLLFNDYKTSLYAACIYFSLPGVILGTRGLTTDTYLTTVVLMAVYSWINYRKNHYLPALYFFYLFLAIGFLIKGPVVFIVPLPVVITYNLLVPGPRSSLIHHIAGFCLFITVGFSWYILLYLENKEFLNYFVVDHTLNRIVTNNFGRSKPFWFFMVTILFTAFPWFLILFHPVFTRAGKRLSEIHVLLIWVLLPLIFFSFMRSKLVLYILPVYAGIAIAAAHIWNSNIKHKRWVWMFIGFAGLLITGLFLTPLIDKNISFNLQTWLILAALALILLMGILFIKRLNSRYFLIIYSIVFTSGIALLSTYIFHENPKMVHDQRNVAEFIKKLPEVSHVYIYNERLPSLAFELDREVISIANGNHHLDRETQFERNEEWKRYLIKPADIDQADIVRSMIVIKEKKQMDSRTAELMIDSGMDQVLIDGWIVYYDSDLSTVSPSISSN